MLVTIVWGNKGLGYPTAHHIGKQLQGKTCSFTQCSLLAMELCNAPLGHWDSLEKQEEMQILTHLLPKSW